MGKRGTEWGRVCCSPPGLGTVSESRSFLVSLQGMQNAAPAPCL